MADWALPTIGSLKVDVLDILKLRDVDAITLAENPTAPPALAKRWVIATKKFQEWNGTIWTDMVLGIEGGGTGAADVAGIISNLNLGTMALQNSNNVNISGGSISGLSGLGVAGNMVVSGLSTFNGSSNTFNGAIQVNASIAAIGRITASGGISSSDLQIENVSPIIYFTETDEAANQRVWRTIINGAGYYIQALSDNLSVANTAISIGRAGTDINGFAFYTHAGSCNLRLEGPAGYQSGFTAYAGGTHNGNFVFQNGQGYVDSTNGIVTFRNTAGARLVVQSGFNLILAPDHGDTSAHTCRIQLNPHSTSACPVTISSGEGGVAFDVAIISNNWSNASRINLTKGGSYIRLGSAFAEFNIVHVDGTYGPTLRLDDVHIMRMPSVESYFYFGPNVATAPFITTQANVFQFSHPNSNVKLSANGTITFHSTATQDSIFQTSTPRPNADAGIHNGLPSFRWHTIYAFTGIINTSDERMKIKNGGIRRAKDIVRRLEPFMGRHILPELPEGETRLVKEDTRFVPMFGAQDVDKLRDLNLDLVYKENPDSWGLNYAHFVPILWQCVKEMLEDAGQ